MTEVEVWFMYLFIMGFCFLVSYLIKDGNKNGVLVYIKGLSTVAGVVIGITFAFLTLMYILSAVFPKFMNTQIKGNYDYQCDRDPLFGGCN